MSLFYVFFNLIGNKCYGFFAKETPMIFVYKVERSICKMAEPLFLVLLKSCFNLLAMACISHFFIPLQWFVSNLTCKEMNNRAIISETGSLSLSSAIDSFSLLNIPSIFTIIGSGTSGFCFNIFSIRRIAISAPVQKPDTNTLLEYRSGVTISA